MKFLLLPLAIILVAAMSVQGQSCDWCGGQLSNIPDPNKAASFDGTIKCQDHFNWLAGPYDAEGCAGIKPFEKICCPALAPRECFLCADAQADFIASKNIGESTCGQADMLLMITSKEECAEIKKPYDAHLDLPSYCGCANSTTLNNYTCNPCGAGKEVNFSATIIDEDGESESCGVGALAAKYITNDAACEQLVKAALNSTCCVPTGSTSSGINLSISSLATALIVGLASFAI